VYDATQIKRKAAHTARVAAQAIAKSKNPVPTMDHIHNGQPKKKEEKEDDDNAFEFSNFAADVKEAPKTDAPKADDFAVLAPLPAGAKACVHAAGKFEKKI